VHVYDMTLMLQNNCFIYRTIMLIVYRFQVAQMEILMSALPIATANFIRPHRPDHKERLAPGQLSARLALDRKTRNQVFALRHASYLAGGYIDARPDRLFSDPYDDQPNCVSLIIYKMQLPVASVRLCTVDLDPAKTGWTDIPGLHVFEDEIHQLLGEAPDRDTPTRATEINRLVRHPDFANDFELVFILFRFVSFMVLHQKSDMMLSCVRRNHMPFYKRLEFATIAGPRSYPELKFTTNLMACPSARYPTILNKYEILNSGAVESGCYDGLFQGETVNVFGEI
jgi:hypothetical protein